MRLDAAVQFVAVLIENRATDDHTAFKLHHTYILHLLFGNETSNGSKELCIINPDST